jgi:hypothetical protein
MPSGRPEPWQITQKVRKLAVMFRYLGSFDEEVRS